jgi:hypothetical protein
VWDVTKKVAHPKRSLSKLVQQLFFFISFPSPSKQACIFHCDPFSHVTSRSISPITLSKRRRDVANKTSLSLFLPTAESDAMLFYLFNFGAESPSQHGGATDVVKTGRFLQAK